MLPDTHARWLLTRWGEAQILVPALALLAGWLWSTAASRPIARRWLLGTAAAAALTTASKVLFLGWGLGVAAWDFTGLSGHAMFAAAVLPLVGALAGGGHRPHGPRVGAAIGVALAALVAWSRVAIGAHSLSEVLLGWGLGSGVALHALRVPAAPRAPVPAWLIAGLGAWLVLAPLALPRSFTHEKVTALALQLSGHDRPCTREQLHAKAVPR